MLKQKIHQEESEVSARRRALELMRNEGGSHLASYDKFFLAMQQNPDRRDILWESSDGKWSRVILNVD